jgi:hypothetical protein
LAIVVAAVLSVAACGKSSGEDKLSRTALPAEANPICAEATADLSATRQPIGITNPSQAETYYRARQRIQRKATSDLKKLKPHDDVKRDYEAYLAARTEELDLVDTIVKKAAARDRSGLTDIKRLRGLERRSRAAAKKSGLAACAD